MQLKQAIYNHQKNRLMKLSQSINPMKKGQRIISSEDGRLIARVEPEEIENFADIEIIAKDICTAYNSAKEMKGALEATLEELKTATSLLNVPHTEIKAIEQAKQALKNYTL